MMRNDQQQHEEPDVIGPLVRELLEGNLLYIASALLMIAGCYLLMKSPLITGGEYAQVLKSLLVLQGYELLVVATAVAILRRFRSVGDAFVLLMVELALLLDPTFFKNNFFSMMINGIPASLVWGTNAVCLGLAVVKLAVLQHFLGFRMSGRAGAWLLAAGGFVYLAAGPLGKQGLGTTAPVQWQLLCGYAAVLLALAAPPVPANVLRPAVGATPEQERAMPRLLFALPLALVAMHQIETSIVYQVAYGAVLAPTLLMASVLLVRSADRDEPQMYLLGMDVLALLGAVATLHSAEEWGNPRSQVQVGTLAVAGSFGAAAVLLYVEFWRRHRSPAALWRVAIAVAGAAIYAASTFGVFGLLLDALKLIALPISRQGWFSKEMLAHLAAAGTCGVAGWAAWRFRNPVAFCVAAISGSVFAARIVPGDQVAPAIAFSLFSFALAWELFERGKHPFVAVLMVILSEHVATASGTPLGYGIAFAVLPYFAAAALRSVPLAAGGVCAVAVLAYRKVGGVAADPAVAAIAAGLGLFVAAAFITFHREKLLARFAPPAPIPPLRMYAPLPTPMHQAASEPVLPPPQPDAGAGPEEAEEPLPIAEPLAPNLPEPTLSISDGRVARLVSDVFITQRGHRLWNARDLEPYLRSRFRSNLQVPPGVADLFWACDLESEALVGRVVIAEDGVRLAEEDGSSVFLAFAQLSRVTSAHATLHLIGHAHQEVTTTCLSFAQAKALKAGLSLIVAELAEED